MRRVALLTSLALLTTATAQAYYMTGNSIVQDCDAMNAACISYVTGVVDGQWWGEPNMNCIPDGVTTGQLAQVVRKYLAEHPERLHLNAPVLVADAVSGAWPCAQ
jgi:hypothetical protein